MAENTQNGWERLSLTPEVLERFNLSPELSEALESDANDFVRRHIQGQRVDNILQQLEDEDEVKYLGGIVLKLSINQIARVLQDAQVLSNFVKRKYSECKTQEEKEAIMKEFNAQESLLNFANQLMKVEAKVTV